MAFFLYSYKKQGLIIEEICDKKKEIYLNYTFKYISL